MEAFLLALLFSAANGREALRFESVHEQEGDRSCGLAAVASLSDLYWRRPCGEAALRTALASEEGMEERATDLAELSRLLEFLGFAVRAVRLDVNGAAEAVRRGYAPMILHLKDDGGHFALLLGMERGIAVLADPARGVFTLRTEELDASFSGAALAAVLPGRVMDRDALDYASARAVLARSLLEDLLRGALP